MKPIKMAAIIAAGAFAVMASGANAQATRTFVSGVGNDANPCSRTAPCRTFAGAFNKTAPGGEINCLDPGGYGGLTINKSISIICQYTEGGMLVAGAGVNGITVNAGATDSVYLRGIDFQGSTTATNGFRILAGGVVHLQDSVIRRFNAASGLGIRITPSGATKVTIVNTTIADNGSGATGGGILIQPTGAGGSARVFLDKVSVLNNSNNALHIDTTGNTGGGVVAVIQDSSFVGSTFGIQVTTAVGTSPAVAMVTNSEVFDNGGAGIRANGGAARARVRNSTITGNSTGVITLNSGAIQSFGNNNLEFNTTDGTFTPPTILEE